MLFVSLGDKEHSTSFRLTVTGGPNTLDNLCKKGFHYVQSPPFKRNNAYTLLLERRLKLSSYNPTQGVRALARSCTLGLLRFDK